MAREEQQPMSAARLAEIREARFDAWLREMPDDPALLMVEVGRLREENLVLRARERPLLVLLRAVPSPMIDTLVTAWFAYHFLNGETLDDLRQHWVIRLALWATGKGDDDEA